MSRPRGFLFLRVAAGAYGRAGRGGYNQTFQTLALEPVMADEPIILGQQLAAARKEEEARLAAGDAAPSPLGAKATTTGAASSISTTRRRYRWMSGFRPCVTSMRKSIPRRGHRCAGR
jgi:hypothetical protein